MSRQLRIVRILKRVGRAFPSTAMTHHRAPGWPSSRRSAPSARCSSRSAGQRPSFAATRAILDRVALPFGGGLCRPRERRHLRYAGNCARAWRAPGCAGGLSRQRLCGLGAERHADLEPLGAAQDGDADAVAGGWSAIVATSSLGPAIAVRARRRSCRRCAGRRPLPGRPARPARPARRARHGREFVRRVADREQLSRSEAYDHVWAVFNVLGEAVTARESHMSGRCCHRSSLCSSIPRAAPGGPTLTPAGRTETTFSAKRRAVA